MSDKGPDIRLPGGLRMPAIGLGTMRLKEEAHAEFLEYALDIGYKLLDTAYVYGNETLIGKVISERISSGRMKREDVFVTTKLPGIFMDSAKSVRRCLELCLSHLNVDYVDLFLMHSPCGFKYVSDENIFPTDDKGKHLFAHHDIVETWQAMELLVDAGLAKSIGVSNFNAEQMSRVLEKARIPIANLQIECHPYLQQKELREFCKSRGISVTAYGSLGGIYKPESSGKQSIVEDPVVTQIAENKKITPGQVILGFLLEEGVAIIPKSSKKSRLKENLEAASVTFTDEEVDQLRKLNSGLRYYDFKRLLVGHPEFHL